MMYHTLLVPLDGSAYSERALTMATALARHLKAQLVLVRAASASVFPGTDATDAQVQAVREAQTYLEELASGISGQGLDVVTAVPYGDAAEEVLMEIGLHHADLTVMCTHGRSGLGRYIYGSVAEQVLHRSPVPVLLVHPTGETGTLAPQPAHTSFLVPLDGSVFAEAALPHAVAMARAYEGNIMLLQAIEPPVPAYSYAVVSPVPPSSGRLQEEAESYLEDVAGRLRSADLSVETIVREGWPSDIIARQGAGLRPGLIIMATHGRTGVARLLLGSVALEVVRRSPLPVMLIRPTGQPAEGS